MNGRYSLLASALNIGQGTRAVKHKNHSAAELWGGVIFSYGKRFARLRTLMRQNDETRNSKDQIFYDKLAGEGKDGEIGDEHDIRSYDESKKCSREMQEKERVDEKPRAV